jgi:cell division septum initiation protein DivIVA
MESFSIVKRGYNPQEVDEYIETLEQVIRSYKDKDNAIKNAIISAQVAADNIVKNAHLEVAEYKQSTIAQLRHIYESVETQRSRMQSFQNDYNNMLRKYMRSFDESDISLIHGRIDELERYLREMSFVEDETDKEDAV